MVGSFPLLMRGSPDGHPGFDIESKACARPGPSPGSSPEAPGAQAGAEAFRGGGDPIGSQSGARSTCVRDGWLLK